MKRRSVTRVWPLLLLVLGGAGALAIALAHALAPDPAPDTGPNWPIASGLLTEPSSTVVTTSAMSRPDDEIDQVKKLAGGLQSNLNYKNLNGLLLSACESGKKGNAARDDLLRTLPMLDPADPNQARKAHFRLADLTADPHEGYHLLFEGAYADGSGPALTIRFRVYVDQGVAAWCGVGH
ncbi:hypothetical protein [Amycolatopsis cihanbeyliensis]|uniref:Uncharacterized protein n=1 Tax=Amycolatopsis cihanbeyliensis TaxID=1128664 RepID=A0A542DRQ3_AMYCI|nr:hypothetical protein [Amycolatopsis cihanbeyliensis]TQJ05788.1 hypothetical protein FB471_5628 [Amycolatopsis cihanbeyliensis]